MATTPTKPETKPTETVTTAPAVEVPGPQFIRAVYGRMVDPLSGLEYTGVPSELLKRTSWVDSQLAAEKLALCDPLEVNPPEPEAAA